MKDDIVNGQRVRCYDDGKSGDRYTVVYMDRPESWEKRGRKAIGTYAAVGMNGAPFHPQGIGQHCAAMPGRHLGKRVALKELPADCQKLVKQDLEEQ